MDGKPDDVMAVCPANGMNCGTLSERGKLARNCLEEVFLLLPTIQFWNY